MPGVQRGFSFVAVVLSAGCASHVTQTDHCTIAGAEFQDGDRNPANDCESCQLGNTSGAWTPRPQGTLCGDGGAVCVQDPTTYNLEERAYQARCTPGCFIDGEFFVPDAGAGTEWCLRCIPEKDTAAWTSLNQGDSCGAHVVCVDVGDAGGPLHCGCINVTSYCGGSGGIFEHACCDGECTDAGICCSDIAIFCWSFDGADARCCTGECCPNGDGGGHCRPLGGGC